MAINDHPNLRFENQRSGSWGNAQVKVVELEDAARAISLVTRVMRIEPGMQINAVHLLVTGVTSGTWDVGYSIGEADNAASAAGTGDQDYFIDAGVLAGVSTNASSMRLATAAGGRPYRPSESGYITLQNKAAVTATTTRITVTVEFEYVGNE